MISYFSEKTGFYGHTDPERLLQEFGSPLYVYNEKIFREKCREMIGLVSYPNFKVTYSAKANSNIRLLKIAREEGLHSDAMSPGEIFFLLKAGYGSEEIFYISNNVSEEEMRYAIDKGIIISVDSISQLRQYGRINPGGNVAVRFNPGIGAGHHEKVVTAGKKTKFGVEMSKVGEVKKVLDEFNLRLVGVNQHIGSLFMEGSSYLEAARELLELAKQFEDLDFIDFGGGFGIPYKKQEGQARLDLEELGSKLDEMFEDWTREYGKRVMFRIEPGRYIAAECGVLLGRIYALKESHGTKFVGTDIGFNVIMRPVMYSSHHDIEVYRDGKLVHNGNREPVTVVGNICESGDIIARDRELVKVKEGDIIGIMDAGAYGYSMASNYNNRLRPAEVLIRLDGTPELIRRRETLEDLIRNLIV
jgi:diaminopimelate decarboxylase